MATNEIEEKRSLTIFWLIENAGVLWDSDHFMISSPEFRTRTFEGKVLKLILEANIELSGTMVLSLLFKLDGGCLDFPTDFECSVIGYKGQLVSTTVQNHKFNFHTYVRLAPGEIFSLEKSAFHPYGNLTVKCRIWKSRGNLLHNELLTCQSQWHIVQNSFLWPIPGFSLLQLCSEVTTHVKFEFFNGSSDFELKFSLQGSSLEDSIAQVILASNLIPESVKVFMKITVVEYEHKTIKEEDEFFRGTTKCCWLPELATRKEILSKKLDCLKNDTLNLYCQFYAINFKATNSIRSRDFGFSNRKENVSNDASTFLDASCQTSETSVGTLDIYPPSEHPLAYLGDDLLNLYREQRMTDFELRAGGVSFPVHKNILSARSPVFRAMFSSDMKESVSNSQDIPELDVHTLNRMLTFLYGGTVEPQLPWESAIKLYYAADKYQVQYLKQQCSSNLRSNITVPNVSAILRLADRHQDKELTSFIHEFFLHNFDEIMLSEEWETFLQTNPLLAGNTVHQLYKKKLLTKRT